MVNFLELFSDRLTINIQPENIMSTLNILAGNPPSLILFLLTFTGYYLMERQVKWFLHHQYPTFYDVLDRQGKIAPYVAFVMGFVMTLASTPVCLSALDDSYLASDQRGGYTTAGNVCIVSKAVLWTAELNRLDFSNGYVVHHLSSLMHMIHSLYLQDPLRPIYAVYASLATELFSDAASIMLYHDLRQAESRMAYAVQAINVVLLALVRAPAIAYGIPYILRSWPITSPAFWTHSLMTFLYARFLVNTVIRDVARLKMIQRSTDSRGRPSILLMYKLNVSYYGMFVSLAALATSALAWFLSVFNSSPSIQTGDISSLCRIFLQTAVVSFVGARLPDVISAKEFYSSPLWARTGYSLQGAMLAGMLFVGLSPGPLLQKQRLDVLAAACVASLVGESIGRVGCHFGGCCGSSSGDGKHRNEVSAPLLTSILTGTSALIILGLHLISNTFHLHVAGALALTAQASIRLYVSRFRKDVTPMMHIAVIGQVILGLGMLMNSIKNLPVYSSGLMDYSQKIIVMSSDTGSVFTKLASDPWAGALAFGLLLPGSFVQACASGGG